jgi:hypothetical protein
MAVEKSTQKRKIDHVSETVMWITHAKISFPSSHSVQKRNM